MRNRNQGFDIVDRRRLTEDAGDGGKWRFDTGIAAAPLEGVHQRRLFAADVRAGAAMNPEIHRLPRSHRVGADDPGHVCLAERGFHALDRFGELPANVDVRRFSADSVGGDRASLHQCVRRPTHDLAVLEGARFRFVGVAAEVMRLPVPRLHERPFQSGGKPRAPPTAQSRFLDDRDDVGRRHRERLLERSVTSAPLPAVQRRCLTIAEVLREHRCLFGVRLVWISHVT